MSPAVCQPGEFYEPQSNVCSQEDIYYVITFDLDWSVNLCSRSSLKISSLPVFRLRKTSFCDRSWKIFRSATRTGSSCGSPSTEHLKVSPPTVTTFTCELELFQTGTISSFCTHLLITPVY